MIRTYLPPILAIAGVLMAIHMVLQGARPLPAAPPVSSPAAAPFTSFVAGAGIVEPSTEPIAVGTPEGNIVTQVFVSVGEKVKVGDPLFKLDDRVLSRELAVRQKEVEVAKARLVRLEAGARPEDIPPLDARVRQAEAALNDSKAQWATYESISDPRAISAEEKVRRRYAVDAATARLEEAKAQLALTKAGTWKYDIDSARVDVERAQSVVEWYQSQMQRRTIRAMTEGEVLQVKIRVGEWAQPGVLATPLMVIGRTDELHVRVDIDENDAYRVRRGAKAVAFARGNRDIQTPLTFVRFEPYVVPKKSLTGDSTERVDTRVLQAIFSFPPGELSLYVGQQMDVFIEAADAGAVVRAPVGAAQISNGVSSPTTRPATAAEVAR